MPNEDGTLRNDVVIGEYMRPWDAKPEAKRLAPGIPKAALWAYDPKGIDQVGCVYTAQGFEFDYVGVIFGDDLVYNFDNQDWQGNPARSSDSVVKRAKGKFTDLVKNTYRVLLSRGMKGCYVCFMDKDTERFFKSRIETRKGTLEEPLRYSDVVQPEEEMKILDDVLDAAKFKEYLPFYSLSAACGKFGEGRTDIDPKGWMRINRKGLDGSMFVVRAAGHSMEPKIKDGDFCIFKANPVGPYSGLNRVYLFQYQGEPDSETGGAYTIKGYRSYKGSDGLNISVELIPLNKTYPVLKFENKDDDISLKLSFVAEFISVLKS